MKFISRYRNYRLGVRPTIKKPVHSASGAEDILTYRGITVEFKDATFDTSEWEQYRRPEAPPEIDTVRSEDDLIRLMKASPYFNADFFEHKEQSIEEKRAQLMAQLRELDAIEAASDPESAPTIEQDPSDPIPKAPKAPKKVAAAKGKKAPTKSEQRRTTAQKESHIEL